MKKLIATGVVAAVFVGGCGVGDDASREDAHDVIGAAVDKTAPEVYAFNNHYPNIETKCDQHGHRFFVQTHDSAEGQNMIILPDPTCPGYVAGKEPAVVATP